MDDAVTGHGPALVRWVDRATLAVALVSKLRAKGAAVDFAAAGTFVRALDRGLPQSRTELYWTARIGLIRRREDIAVFDAVFAAAFDGAVLSLDPNTRRDPLGADPPVTRDVQLPPDGADENADGAGLPWVTRPSVVGTSEDTDRELAVPLRQPGELEALAERPFEVLSAAEMAELGDWLRDAVRHWPTRTSRRRAPGDAGRAVALRPTMATARRTGFEPVHLVRTAPVRRPRRLVMLCDVSQSMQAQATAYLHLMRALALGAPAEVYAFATRLTRLTAVLAQRSTVDAIAQATVKVDDRFGGTRIASNISALLASHHGNAVRGAIVIIGSDGWDSEAPERLGAAMERLRRRAHRVIWMNPRAGAPGFAPEVASMAAALPSCDQLLPADTFASLARVVAAVGASPRPVSSRASRGSRVGTDRR